MKKAVVIVAHPDDETIWMGGTVIKNPGIDWTVLALCRRDDPDRMPKFRQVCRFYGAKPIISDLEDEGKMSLEESLPEIKGRILAELGKERFDYIFTHGFNGEYGHKRHLGVHLAVKELKENGSLKTRKIFFFAYETKSGRIQNAGFSTLKNKVLGEKKRKIIADLYGFSDSSFEYLSCLENETFYENSGLGF